MARCKKLRYKDMISAQYAFLALSGQQPDLKSIYKCNSCRGWHLSTEESRKHYGR